MTQDALIIGGGHNGLVCAYYLARAGHKVRVLERRDVVGGAAVTEEFHPGFRNSVASYTVSLLNPKIIQDMDLAAFGLRIVERKVNNLWPHPNGDFIAYPVGDTATKAEIARFSEKDAAALDRYSRDIEMVADLVRDFLLETPPNVGGGLRDIFKAAKFGNRLRKLSLEDERIVLDIFTKSVGDFLDLYFENDHVKASFAFDGVVGNYADSQTPGSAYVLMHHAFGEVNGKKGVWGHAIGGMGAITQAMARAVQALGVEIETGQAVREVIIEEGRATGVRLESGQEHRARIIASNLNPSLLYSKLVDNRHLPEDFSRRMTHYKNGSGTFRMNVALNRLPQFTCLEQQDRATADHLTSGIVIAPTLRYLDQAFRDARELGWAREPIIEMLIPSTLDDSLAPEGQHVASLFCQQFDPDVDWDRHREDAADAIIAQVEKYAPGFTDSIVGRQMLSPLDLERTFGLTRGDIMHGQLSLDQMFSARPLLGHGNYRAPIRGLYMCGSGTHPGGGVTGAPGHNAAHEILRDHKA
ncbi:phytoene desaturase family protein [Paremcibacter congregatus]|uniref:Pyridine nucleotide-disulfide oxidoreductase domain-containing protein 2 n=1 Tax=Paremcibacter congregatus TaxID=2043170 RepID=A0A2G4YLN3_9PROT|nr:NAD(P)/FAD-dependent oxidoreductase [Paremcibacter congregatus]PHZ83210.1 FAD-dependent oxidoreductase [Paremcibacter congregatus]QDE28320.1 NAD(P)/FAD-dependent oxidoreductase [Paremcibacter congregatus]